MDDSHAMDLCADLKESVAEILRPIREEQLANTPDNRLLLQRKTEFYLKVLPNINTFEVICNEENNTPDVVDDNYFLVTIVVEFKEHVGRHYGFTIMV